MSSVRDALGYDEIRLASPDYGDRPQVVNLSAEVVRQAADRSIPLTHPNDALDLSRDLLVDEAVSKACGSAYVWKIDDGVLYVWPEYVRIEGFPSWP